MPIDTNILVSLHGNRIGLNKNGDLIVDGKLVRSSGANPMQQVVFSDDFLGDALDGRYNFQEGSDSATSAFAITTGENGRAIITTGDSATVTMAGNGAQVDLGALQFYADNGGLAFETILKLDAITAVALFVGFTDQIAALEMPWGLSVVTYTSNQSDGCGFLFDTAATTDTIRCVGVKGNTDGTPVDTGIAFVADTDMKLRVEVGADETAKFYINGTLVGTIASALTKTVALTPVIASYSSEAVSKIVNLDTFDCRSDRG